MAPTKGIVSTDELNRLTRGPTEGFRMEVESRIETLQELWTRLLITVHDPSVSDQHMTAACNALCFILRASSASSNLELQSFVYSGLTWEQTFASARAAFAIGKNKPALQVLETLAVLSNSNSDRRTVGECVQTATVDMVKIVFDQCPKKSLKEACIVLYFFLKKLSEFTSFTGTTRQALKETESSFSRHCRDAHVKWDATNEASGSPWYELVLALLMALRVAESKTATLKLLSLLCHHPLPQSSADMVGIVNRAIRVYGESDDVALEDVSRHVLPSILTNADQFNAFLASQSQKPITSEADILVVVALLQLGKKKAFISEPDLPTYVNSTILRQQTFLQSHDTYAGFGYLLSHVSPAVRLQSCELLTSCNSPKVPIPREALGCLLKALTSLHNDTDAFYRGELLSVFRRLWRRILQYRYTLYDYTQSPHKLLVQSEIATGVDDFIHQYIVFLVSELSPHLSYGRHILALDILVCIAQDDNAIAGQNLPPHLFAVQPLLGSLLRLVLDPYDDVRSTAAHALSKFKGLSWNFAGMAEIFKERVTAQHTVSSATRLAAATNRADHADALGRLIDLAHLEEESPERHLSAMVQKLSVFVNSFVNSLEDFDISTQYPLHGNMLAIAHIIRRNGPLAVSEISAVPLQENLLVVCWGIWMLSQPHLCVDSPELETEVGESELGGPKDQLAYVWRALRDSNLLMQAMIEAFAPRLALIKMVGDLCLDQLALLRHRGAFSTVAQTFLLCCQKARASEEPEVQGLIKKWLDQAVQELDKQADRLTRRSAGLPAMFTALLHPSDRQEFLGPFKILVEIATLHQPALEGVAENQMRLPQVHGLNCLKDIMITSRFRVLTEPLVVLTLNIATQSMSSPIWAIKNCGLMLLRASINRVDPESALRASEEARNLYTDDSMHRGPFDVAVLLLGGQDSQNGKVEIPSGMSSETYRSDTGTEAEFAGLDLLGRLHIRNHDRPLAKALAMRKLKHNLWHVRAQAARLLAEITPHEEQVQIFSEVLGSVGTSSTVNEAHGRLLVALEVLPKIKSDGDWPKSLPATIEALLNLSSVRLLASDLTLTVCWLELACQILEPCTASDLASKQLRDAFLQNLLPQLPAIEHARGSALFNRAFCIFTLFVGTYPTTAAMGELSMASTKDVDVRLHIMISLCTESTIRSENIAHVVVQTILNSEHSDTCATAMKAYSHIDDRLVPKLPVELAELLNVLDFSSLVTREVFNSQILFYACLCRQAWSSTCSEACLLKLQQMAQAFCLHLRMAASDEIECGTRRAAADALLQWKGVMNLSSKLDKIFDVAERLELLSVTYDLLNDDDDEVRAMACQVETAFSAGQDRQSTVDSTLCAVSSRTRLRAATSEHFKTNSKELLEVECLRRLVGMNMAVARRGLTGALQTHLRDLRVRKQLEQLIATADDLFAEERQNLYIDEVAETRAWTGVLANLEIHDALRQSLNEWLMDAMASLVEALSNPSKKLKLENSLDFELLIIRTVSVARLMRVFGDELHTLAEKCKQAHLSESVLGAFTQPFA